MQVEEWGSGPTVALLHGNLPPESIRPLAEALADDFHVLVPTLPGYTGTSPLDLDGQAYRREALAEAIAARSDVAAVSLVGHSYGSYHAFDLALNSALAVGAIVGLGPMAGLADDEEREQFREFARLLRDGQDLTEVALARWQPPEHLQTPPGLAATISEWLGDAGLPLDLEVVADAPDLTERLGHITAPVYLRVGEFDAATPPQQAEALARQLSNATLDVVEGVGHLYAQQDLEATAEAIFEFLGGARRTEILTVAEVHEGL